MFRQRLLTTLVLVPLVLAAIYYSNFWVFASVVVLMMMACGLEWLQLIPLHHLTTKIVFLLLLFCISLVIHYVYSYWLLLGLGLWLLIFLALLSYPRSQALWGHSFIIALFCLLLLPLFGQSLMSIYELESGKNLIVYLMCLVWAADIGAYLAGKLWGKHKLIPAVSPGKTIEGVAGGIFLCMLVALAGYYYFKPQAALAWGIIALLVFMISLLGDLFISMLKRRSHLKDTGHLLPGHGGILDRLDSLIAAAPAFYFGLEYLASGTIKWLIR